jgi:glycosyltransferase involved in cell wall biosynthesis
LNRPLRIVQANSLFNGGGVDTQTLELTRGLQEQGCEVTLAVGAGSRWEPRARQLSVEVQTFAARSPLRWKAVAALRRAVSRIDADILHVHQGCDYWPAIVAARLAGRGTQVFITRHLMTRPRGFSRRFLLKGARVIAVSRAVERVLRAELQGNPSRILQAYCGIDVERFAGGRPAEADALRRALGWGSDHVVFGVVGMYPLPRGKGQLEFLSAAAQLRTSYPKARFVLIGHGDMRPLIEQKIASEQLQDIVRLEPFTDDIRGWMKALDVLVHPAVGTDAFPLVVLEGMASGHPIVASRMDGIPEEFTEGQEGYLVTPGDVSELAVAMGRLASNPELRSSMGGRGRLHVATHFTRSHLAAATLRHYTAALADRR